MEYYFAYGSNIDVQQMHNRIGSAELVSKATLLDHKLFASHRSKNWKGGVFSIESAMNETVNGVIYKIDAHELWNLDRYEGYPRVYYREKMSVQLPNNRLIKCWVYYSVKIEESIQISERYLDQYLNACRESGVVPSFKL